MAKAFEVYIPIYKKYLYVLVGAPKESVEALMEKYDFGDKNAEALTELYGKHSKTCAGLFNYNEEDNTYKIWLKEEPVTIEGEAVLLHEINHAVFYMLDNLGMEHTQESDEAYAYLSEYLYIEIMTKFEESYEETTSNN